MCSFFLAFSFESRFINYRKVLVWKQKKKSMDWRKQHFMSWFVIWIFTPIFQTLIFSFFFHFSFLLRIWLCLSAFYRCSKYDRFVFSIPNFKGWIFVDIGGGSNWLLSCHASSWNCQGKQMKYDGWVVADRKSISLVGR